MDIQVYKSLSNAIFSCNKSIFNSICYRKNQTIILIISQKISDAIACPVYNLPTDVAFALLYCHKTKQNLSRRFQNLFFSVNTIKPNANPI
jgi:hypothetical protein